MTQKYIVIITGLLSLTGTASVMGGDMEPAMINDRRFYRPGTIHGKAMGTLDSGTGTIEVLVTLQ